ncbi:MAG TPA: ABC transporter permease [Anaeromyxobacteraceae bacterium]|nr:ABC transporter permease [Anaeromyxobacteraceae bacterium]
MSAATARRQLAAVFRKEVRQTVRDRRVMFLLVVAPLIQTLVFGFAVDFDVDNVPTVVVDHDRSDTSRLHARRVLADGTLRRVGDAAGLPEAERRLDDGQAAAVVVLPEGLAADLAAGRAAEVQVLLDGTDPNRAGVAGGAASRYFGDLGERLARERLAARGRPPPAQAVLVPQVAYNPRLKTAPYVVPGISATLLVIVTTLVTAMGLAREREMGTLEQVMVTPIRPIWLLLGKLLPYLVIGSFDVLLLVSVGTWVFGVPIRGSLLVVAAGMLVYLLSTLGIGLFISTVSETQQQAFLGGFLFMMPSILLSGVMTPIAGMPRWLQLVTYLNPVRHFAEVVRAVLLRGAGLGDVWFQLASLLLLGTGILWLAASRFRTTLA